MEKHIHKQSQIGSHLISIAQLCDFYEEVTRFLIEVKFVLFEYVSWLRRVLEYLMILIHVFLNNSEW